MSIEDKLDKICIKHHGELPRVSAEEALRNLSDAMVDNIINTPDAEILQEVKEDYDDENFLVNKARVILEKIKKRVPIITHEMLIQAGKEWDGTCPFFDKHGECAIASVKNCNEYRDKVYGLNKND